jgi:hypothetical protein
MLVARVTFGRIHNRKPGLKYSCASTPMTTIKERTYLSQLNASVPISYASKLAFKLRAIPSFFIRK